MVGSRTRHERDLCDRGCISANEQAPFIYADAPPLAWKHRKGSGDCTIFRVWQIYFHRGRWFSAARGRGIRDFLDYLFVRSSLSRSNARRGPRMIEFPDYIAIVPHVSVSFGTFTLTCFGFYACSAYCGTKCGSLAPIARARFWEIIVSSFALRLTIDTLSS